MDNKLKVLFISVSIRQRAGITSVIRSYFSHFDWNRIQVDLLVQSYVEQEALDDLTRYGAKVFFMPVLGLKNIHTFKVFINNFFTEHQYDIVHSHFFQLDCLVFPVVKKLSRSVCISHSHSTKLSDHRLNALRNRLMSFRIGKVADVWAACSNEAGIALFGKKFPKSPKRYIVRNGIDCKRFAFNMEDRQKIREEFNFNDKDIVVGHIGRFTPGKNQSFMVDVLAELLKIKDNYRLLLIGDGPQYQEIHDKVKKFGLEDKVTFGGVRRDVPQVLSAFDLFLFPSVYEGLGIVAVEAQANGLKCVVSDTVPRDVDLTGVSWLSIKDSPQIWAQHINSLSFERHPDYNKKVIDANYDIQSAAAELQTFYENLVTESKVR